MMSENELSLIEALHNTFFYFVEGLGVMALDATKQKEQVGGAHAAWELQNDVLDSGETVLRCAGPFLSQSERMDVVSLLSKIRTLPPDALRSSDEALDHPAWEDLRREAAHLLARLGKPIAENLSFFNNRPPTPRG